MPQAGPTAEDPKGWELPKRVRLSKRVEITDDEIADRLRKSDPLRDWATPTGRSAEEIRAMPLPDDDDERDDATHDD